MQSAANPKLYLKDSVKIDKTLPRPANNEKKYNYNVFANVFTNYCMFILLPNS